MLSTPNESAHVIYILLYVYASLVDCEFNARFEDTAQLASAELSKFIINIISTRFSLMWHHPSTHLTAHFSPVTFLIKRISL